MLDEKIQEELKQQLLKKKEDLEEKLSKVAVRDEEDGTWEAKYFDEERDDEVNANEVEEWTNQTSVVNVLIKDLKAVELALDKMEKGVYGKCEVCGIDIPAERLKAFPEARTCTKCTLPE
jgi:RNA polymerase-binding transcription factor DksA